MPVADLYGEHWSLTGRGVPGQTSPDEAVFLPGRNLLLLGKAMLWCHLHGVGAVALGSLQTNPFPDATPEFFAALEDVVNRAVHGSVRISLPFAGLHKVDVMHRGRGLPLQHTFSCISPRDGWHCGQCNKCGERRTAFAEALMVDPTTYSTT
jgi:7-cyano-7-deazaguanine synthase